MITSPRKPAHIRAWAVASALMGIGVLYFCLAAPAKHPQRAGLIELQGRVSSVEPDRYGVNFRLDQDDRTFFYARRNGAIESVSSALTNPTEQPVSFAVDPEPHQGLSSPPFFDVLEIATATGNLRTYDQIRASWREDYVYGVATGLFLLFGAAVLELCARRSQPNNSSKPTPLRGAA
ncbi:hypothetical protein PAGU2595_028590 [Lysobacter xanthus]